MGFADWNAPALGRILDQQGVGNVGNSTTYQLQRTGAPTMTVCPTGNPTDASGVVATADTPDGALPPGDTREARDNATIAENDTSNSSRNISQGACLPFWKITCMLVSAVVVCCFDMQVA